MRVSDSVLEQELPESVASSVEAWVSCVGGASMRQDYLQAIKGAGFSEIHIQSEQNFGATYPADDPFIQALASKHRVPREELTVTLNSITSLGLLIKKPEESNAN